MHKLHSKICGLKFKKNFFEGFIDLVTKLYDIKDEKSKF